MEQVTCIPYDIPWYIYNVRTYLHKRYAHASATVVEYEYHMMHVFTDFETMSECREPSVVVHRKAFLLCKVGCVAGSTVCVPHVLVLDVHLEGGVNM